VHEHCGEVDGEAFSKLQALPDWHPDWDRKSRSRNLDVRKTSHAHVEELSEALATLPSGGSDA
jgi:hypothetical protein